MNRAFKIISISWIMLIVAALISSCGNSNQTKNTDAKEKAEEHNDAKFSDNKLESDAQYIVDAYSAGLYEIEAAKHAKEKAATRDVKELAGMIIKQHVDLNDKLKGLAGKKQVTLQESITEEQLEEIKECNSKKDKEYDRAFVDKIVATHKKSVSMFEEASEKATDQDIRNLFSTSLSSLRGHLDMALNIRDRLNKNR